MSRRSVLVSLGVLAACLAVLPGCKKKPADDGGGGGGGDVGLGLGAPPDVSTDYVVFARMDVKSLRDSALYTEIKQAVTKAGGAAEWDKVEGEGGKQFGARPSDIDSATVVVTEMEPGGEPKMVIILTSRAPFQKTGAFGVEPGAKPDSRGLYPAGNDRMLVHYPDDKTAVVLSTDLAPQYLEGYAKNRSGWPLTKGLARAAAGHTAFAVVNIDKLPAEARTKPDMQEFASLLAAKKVVVTANLKGKELSVGVRGSFADPAAAGRAQEKAAALLGLATSAVGDFMAGKELAEFPAVMPAVKEAHRALKAAKPEVAGSDVTLATSYRADFDIGTMAAEAVKKVRGASGRMTASNNLRQIGLALHNYHDSMGRVPVLGVGANGVVLKAPTEKPLLSWRVAILPYIEQDHLYKQFRHNEAWDSEHNKKLIAQMPKAFAPVDKPGQPGHTHLQMVVGPGAMQPPFASIPGSFPDGTSNTIAVAEAADPVIWTKPDDVMMPAKPAAGGLKRKFGGQHPGGFNVVLWDGSVRFVKDTVSERTLGLLVNPADGMALPSDW